MPKNQTLSQQSEEDDFFEELDREVGKGDLKKKIDAILVQGQPTGARDGSHLSDIRGDFCYRSVVLSHFYSSNLVFHSARTSMIFQNGNDLHARWQAAFERAGVALAIEQTHREQYYDTVFHPDMIILLDNRKYIVELKGYRQEEYLRLVKGKKAPMDAIVQANSYMWITGIHNALIIVENKNTQEYAIWDIKYDPEMSLPKEKDLQVIKQVCDIHEQDGRLPKRLDECVSPNDAKPKTCRYRDACFATKKQRETMRL